MIIIYIVIDHAAIIYPFIPGIYKYMVSIIYKYIKQAMTGVTNTPGQTEDLISFHNDIYRCIDKNF